MNQINVSSDTHVKRAGLMAARVGSDFNHRLGVPLAIAPPKYPIRPGTRHPVAAKAGMTVVLTVEDLKKHEEHAEHRRWVCRHAGCAHKRWFSKEEMIAEHLPDTELQRLAEQHVYLVLLEVPAEGVRPAIVRLLSEVA